MLVANDLEQNGVEERKTIFLGAMWEILNKAATVDAHAEKYLVVETQLFLDVICITADCSCSFLYTDIF